MTTILIDGVRIVDLPDLGPVTDNSSVVGEHAGAGLFRATAVRDYVAGTVSGLVSTETAARIASDAVLTAAINGETAARIAGDAAAAAGAWRNTANPKLPNSTVAPADIGTTLILGGGVFSQLTFGTASGYAANHFNFLVNEDTYPGGRAKWIAVSGLNSDGGFFLWPGQTNLVYAQHNVWYVAFSTKWKHPGGNLNFYTAYNSGTDVFGATDGLDQGAPFRSVNFALGLILDQIDFQGRSDIANSRAVINMAPSQNDNQGIHFSPHDMRGAQGGAAITVSGATLSILGAANNGGGAIRLTLASAASFVTNQVVGVYAVTGTTEANGFWKIVVVDDTHIDLVNSVFTNAYSSGGVITNGSGFNCAAQDCVQAYFGAVLQLQNLTFVTSNNWNGLSIQDHAKVYLLPGNHFDTCGSGAHMFATRGGIIEADFPIGISNPAAYHVNVGNGGQYIATAQAHTYFANGVAFTAFVSATGPSEAQFQGSIILNGYTVTGTRAAAQVNGAIVSATGVPNTYFPGNVNFSAATGGQVV